MLKKLKTNKTIKKKKITEVQHSQKDKFKKEKEKIENKTIFRIFQVKFWKLMATGTLLVLHCLI